MHHALSEHQDSIRKGTERIDLCHSTDIKLNELVRLDLNRLASDKNIISRCFDFLIRRQTGFCDDGLYEPEDMWRGVIKNAVKNRFGFNGIGTRTILFDPGALPRFVVTIEINRQPVATEPWHSVRIPCFERKRVCFAKFYRR